MRNFKKNIKTKKRESTTLASGLGVVVVKRKREKMNSVSLVSRQHVRKKKTEKIEKQKKKSAQPWRADWGFCANI